MCFTFTWLMGENAEAFTLYTIFSLIAVITGIVIYRFVRLVCYYIHMFILLHHSLPIATKYEQTICTHLWFSIFLLVLVQLVERGSTRSRVSVYLLHKMIHLFFLPISVCRIGGLSTTAAAAAIRATYNSTPQQHSRKMGSHILNHLKLVSIGKHREAGREREQEEVEQEARSQETV